MSGNRWTEGPWIVNPNQRRVEWDGGWRNDGYIIAGEFLGPDAQWNLNLCAASPAMAEALEKAKDALVKIRACSIAGASEGYTKPEVWGEALFASHADVHAALSQIEAALSLARGETK